MLYNLGKNFVSTWSFLSYNFNVFSGNVFIFKTVLNLLIDSLQNLYHSNKKYALSDNMM